MKQKHYLISILGPTAIGKTALSIGLANHFNCDILSCDSRQFFKEMRIGTAVPEPEELAAARHHFIQNKSIHEEYNVGQFENEALEKLDQLFQKQPIQIMVGGSGLYVDAVLKGLDYFPKVDPKIRENLTEQLETKGLLYLQEQLKQLDPETYDAIAIDNPQRVTRALEICIGSGQKFSSFKNKVKKVRNFHSIKIGLIADREIIYDRINRRVDLMIQNGLIEEAKSLLPYKDQNALQTVGYKELFSFFEGSYTKEVAISEIKKNTRRFAKRQLTWFKRDQDTLWFDYTTPTEHIINAIQHKINGI